MCKNTVEIYVPRGFDVMAIDKRCGTTGHYGELILCPKCESKREHIENNTTESEL